ncbi:MAG: hypothetical protein Salg2KO_23360 [Salibacteraceae bacterium]
MGEIWQNNDLKQGFTITSVNGWQCTGELTKEQRNETVKSVIQVPLNCTNGWTGTSLVSLYRWKGTADINFKLTSGIRGNVEIG